MTLFLRQFRGELRKLFARKRTYIGFGAFVVLELVMLAIFQLPRVQRQWRQSIELSGYGFDEYFSGLTLGLMILATTVFLLGALFLALVAGDVVSKEAEDGTMRMTLCRPISRLRLLSLKYLACVLYTFALIFFIGLTALIVGLAREGVGGLFVFLPLDGVVAFHDSSAGFARYLGALPLVSLSMLSVTSLGFALSCFNMKPAAATIVTLTYFFVDFIFKGMPYFQSIKQWFLTTHMATWTNIFRSHISWPAIVEDYAYLFAVDFTLVVVAALFFQQRDFKS